MDTRKSVEKWGIYEIVLDSEKTFTRPFHDVKLTGYFEKDGVVKKTEGFYDGGSNWKIRFMPEETGEYTFYIKSNNEEFDGLRGSFESVAPSSGNHGPVRVDKKFHFSYADGTPFFVMGTTAYAWTYRPEEVRRKTLESFSKHNFNKIRMLVFPKHYTGVYNSLDVSYDPPVYPFAGKPGNFDFQTLNPEYFRNFEDRVKDLMDLGIQADVILFHPYDFGHWGIDRGMGREDDLFYLKYLIARLSAYRNVWWSLANEYDLWYQEGQNLKVDVNIKDWDLIGEYIKANDPYGHPRSVHDLPFGVIYPDREWLTHVCYQHPDTYTLLGDLKSKYGKPVIDDEYQYEGNIRDDWGNSSAETVLLRHWLSAMAGGYATHGEVFIIDGNRKDLFWSYGGTMVGESAPKLKFMKEILESCPYQEMEQDYINSDGHHYFCLSKGDDVYLFFFRYNLPGKGLWYGSWDGSDAEYEATVYDVWNCSVKQKLKVGLRHRFDITEWTAVKLVKTSK